MDKDVIQSFFEGLVESNPDYIALICGAKTLTYDELNTRANQLAHYLQELGVKADTPVALCMERSAELLIVMMAILKAGGAYVPLDSSHPQERLAFILKDTNKPILIINSDLKRKFSFYQEKQILIDKDEKILSSYPSFNPVSLVKPKNLAYVIYTSGSTGKPKGVLIEHRSLVNYSQWFTDYSGCKAQERIDFSSKYIFDMSVSVSIVPLMLGLTVVICDDDTKKEARPFLEHLKSNKINLAKISPGYLKVLLTELRNKAIKLPHLKTVILGGENLYTVDCAAWLEFFPKQTLVNEYGPTEATVAVLEHQVSKANLNLSHTTVPIGRVHSSMPCYILSEDKQQVVQGEVGELYIGGACLARGYLNQPTLTKKQFIKDPFNKKVGARLYKTGDLCRQLDNGLIECIGRIDFQLKIRGFRIEPGEIERTLLGYPSLIDAEVLAQEDKLGEKHLVAYYILAQGSVEPSAQELTDYLQEFLPSYLIPAAFLKVDNFPLTANGKLDRKALPLVQFSASQTYVAPANRIEKKLSKIWSEELGIEQVGIEDNFFELGGHSLSAARIISKINHGLGVEIDLFDFYQEPTIAKLAYLINCLKGIRVKEHKNNLPQKRQFLNSALLPLSDFQLMIWLSNTFEPKVNKLNIVCRKRLQGRLDIKALNYAFQALFKKHEILAYGVLRLRPAQTVQKNKSFKVNVENIEQLSSEKVKAVLEGSLQQLMNYYPWPKNTPKLMARLFRLPNNRTELQIAMSHIIADDRSPDILFADLSHFYSLYREKLDLDQVGIDKQYRAYLFDEHDYSQKHSNRDFAFWDDYLKDSCLFSFPAEEVITNMAAKGIPYSTYLDIPETTLSSFQHFCAENHVSISDGLCAVLGKALMNCCKPIKKQNLIINTIKSLRDNPAYDNTLGCFLRIEPIKLNLDQDLDLSKLSRQVHQSAMELSPYQHFSGLGKLASVGTLRSKQKSIRSYFLHVFTYLYTSIFHTPSLNRQVLNLCERLASFDRANDFLVSCNVRANLFKPESENSGANYFGLKTEKMESYHYDLLQADNFLDVCFMRDEDQNKPCVVLSSNLRPAFREGLVQDIVSIMSQAS